MKKLKKNDAVIDSEKLLTYVQSSDYAAILTEMWKNYREQQAAPYSYIVTVEDFRMLAKGLGADDAWIESYIERHTIRDN